MHNYPKQYAFYLHVILSLTCVMMLKMVIADDLFAIKITHSVENKDPFLPLQIKLKP